MKCDILFLDIDGVIVTDSGRMPGEAISAILKITDGKTDVVIHSAARGDAKRMKALEEYLSQNDIRIADIVNLDIPSKKNAIREWLFNRLQGRDPREMVIVVDDQAEDDWWPEWWPANRFQIIKPDSRAGLRMSDVL